MNIKWFWWKGLRQGIKLKQRTFSLGVRHRRCALHVPINGYAMKKMGILVSVRFLKAPEIQKIKLALRGVYLKCILSGYHILGKNFLLYVMNVT